MEKPAPSLRNPLISAFVLVGVLALGLLLTGIRRLDLAWVTFALVALAIVAGHLAFTHFIYRLGRRSLWLGWKKFTGYSIVAFYFAQTLPRVSWEKDGLIDEKGAVFIFVLTLAATLAGILLFWFQSRPVALAEVGVIEADEIHNRNLRKQRSKERAAAGRRRHLVLHALEWVDALAWAAIAVLLIDIFVFQLYVVPSESMVPAFLTGDRPFTLKASYGPRIPLTQWRLPFLSLPQRGDIVTIANPRYPENHGVDLKKYVSQLVYMLTFTGVNLDAYLPDGKTPKSDPLVKRIVGVPGDRLMMVDDRLYVRREGDADWKAVDEPWAAVDLWKLSPELLAKIAVVRVGEKERAFLDEMDGWRKDLAPGSLAARISSDLAQIETSLSRISPSLLASFSARELPHAASSLAYVRDEAIAAASRGENPFSAPGIRVDDLGLALAVAADAKTRQALRAWAGGGLAAAAVPPADAYERAARTLSLAIKVNLLDRLAIDLGLLASNPPIDAFGSDRRRSALDAEAQRIDAYLSVWDMRDFPAFPSKESYLGPTQYFAMGDNRYNSLDFRYRSEEDHLRPLDPLDPAPVVFSTKLDPFPLEREFIEGRAIFRLWPFNRFGKL